MKRQSKVRDARLLNIGLRLAVLFLCPLLHAEGHPSVPLDKADLEMKEFSKVPGAEAVQLYYADEIDDVEHTEFIYSRIKVLKDSGKRYGNVEIPMLAQTELVDLYAKTTQPDGKVIEFTDRPFQKTVFKGKGLKFLVQAFTLPQVTPGSVLEYKYVLKYHEKGRYLHRWLVQHDI